MFLQESSCETGSLSAEGFAASVLGLLCASALYRLLKCLMSTGEQSVPWERFKASAPSV